MKLLFKFLAVFLAGALLCSCQEKVAGDDSSPDTSADPSTEPSEEPASLDPSQEPDLPRLEILSFSIREYPLSRAVIADNTVDVTVPHGAVLKAVTVDFTLPEGINSNPQSGTVMDLTSGGRIFLSREADGKALKYTIKVTVSPSSESNISAITNREHFSKGEINGTNILFKVPRGSDLTKLSFDVSIPQGAVLSVDLSSPQDLSSPLEVSVTAADGLARTVYRLSAMAYTGKKAVRGVYLPDPSHTYAFSSYDNLCASLDLLQELKFNCLFVCVWARTHTAWESEVLKSNTTYSSLAETSFYSSYYGGDALADMISEGHKRGIKVVLWFEYGMMNAVGGISQTNPLIAVHPDWVAKAHDGKNASVNGTDFYLNTYSPDVQDFMLALVEEALEKYPDVDGIQGDERFPAVPYDSGYDAYTSALYKTQTGNEVPSAPGDTKWLKWRQQIITDYMDRLQKLVRSKGVLMCLAPGQYPWSQTTMLQNWPAWAEDGMLDLLSPQIYTYESYWFYAKTAAGYAGSVYYNPSMILKNGSKLLSEEQLAQQLYSNLEIGTAGESQFWFEGLENRYVQNVFKGIYVEDAVWPFESN